MHKKYFGVLYGLGVVFILSGAVNAGFSKYLMAVPFMILILWISKYKFGSKTLLYSSIALIVFSIAVSHTQSKNPILYPVLSGGYVEVLENGYQRSFDDGSGGFSLKNTEEFECAGCPEITYTELKKGQKSDVLSVRAGHVDFHTAFSVVTEIGVFSEYDYNPSLYFSDTDGEEKYIFVSKPVRAKWAEALSALMYWPIFPITIIGTAQQVVR